MRERPILFSGPMVRAALAVKKTQTRRVMTVRHGCEGPLLTLPETIDMEPTGPGEWIGCDRHGTTVFVRCPYGVPGDRLWVREAWRARLDRDELKPSELDPKWDHPTYVADYPDMTPSGCGGGVGRLRPGMFMPRWASRITLEITDVRVKRLQDISEEEARAEGISLDPVEVTLNGEPTTIHPMQPRIAFAFLWDSINGDRAPWASNPWVWALTFRRLA